MEHREDLSFRWRREGKLAWLFRFVPWLLVLCFVRAKSLQLCPTLWDHVDCSLPGSPVHGILQARILEWIVMPSSRHLPDPGIKPTSLTFPALAGGFFTTSATWERLLVLNTKLKTRTETYEAPKEYADTWEKKLDALSSGHSLKVAGSCVQHHPALIKQGGWPPGSFRYERGLQLPPALQSVSRVLAGPRVPCQGVADSELNRDDSHDLLGRGTPCAHKRERSRAATSLRCHPSRLLRAAKCGPCQHPSRCGSETIDYTDRRGRI